MPAFDFQKWSEQTRCIPQEHILGALQAVIDRKKALDDLPRIQAQAIETSHQYYSAVEATVDRVDGVPVWSAPPGEFAAYPPGARVYHDGRVWEQVDTAVVMGAPGVDPAWMERPEPELEEVTSDGQF